MTKRALILANSLVRLGYGTAGLVRPGVMAPRLVPDTHDRPDVRLYVRGFAAHQVGVGAVGLASLGRRRLEWPAMVLAVGIDVLDVVSAVVEALTRGRVDRDTVGGSALSAAGAVTAAAALRAPE
jgi:hypothetical protein